VTELAFIGDIHGSLPELEEVVEYAISRTRRLVFLGDYVNRGHNSRQVVDYLIRLDGLDGTDCTFLCGNHDQTFLEALLGGSLDALLRMGGAPTIASYVHSPSSDVALQLRKSVPDSHVRFFRTLAPWMMTEHVFATHAPDSAPMEEVEDRYCIYGHLPQENGMPTINRTHALIDTGCGTTEGGRLTCLFWPGLDWFQSSVR
jgi:calcineurin-like phosphoesterase family protein